MARMHEIKAPIGGHHGFTLSLEGFYGVQQIYVMQHPWVFWMVMIVVMV